MSAMSWSSYLEGRIEELSQMLGKVTTALHVRMEQGGLDNENCDPGICPKDRLALNPKSQSAETTEAER